VKGPYAEDAEQRAETELAAVRHSHTALQSQAGCHVLKNIKLTFIYTPEYSSSPKALSSEHHYPHPPIQVDSATVPARTCSSLRTPLGSYYSAVCTGSSIHSPNKQSSKDVSRTFHAHSHTLTHTHAHPHTRTQMHSHAHTPSTRPSPPVKMALLSEASDEGEARLKVRRWTPGRPPVARAVLQRLKLTLHESLASMTNRFAFTSNLRHYIKVLHLESSVKSEREISRGKAVQVDPIKPTLKLPRTKRLKLLYVNMLSSFGFKLCFQFQLAPLHRGLQQQSAEFEKLVKEARAVGTCGTNVRRRHLQARTV